ncbi:hypothetical protein MHOL44478_10765 [Mycobacterium holsaticum DSM 44478]|nr:DUF2867 domain-containing protein [Mycolicibacterium holsaticum]MDA4107741.1 hypothetical protein [Mycolicibacterium holsaticum DSM 44478 = JCM 12374]QZA15269.1 DUF2867 domain-containing protein [Mycolicibacterium holsaticum DSM 44478 = JCM 12374]UNC12459.1 DUF2867 domain-containing protein [Mycolicibacterium holsaticum DSM 44478 = JCM 12374]
MFGSRLLTAADHTGHPWRIHVITKDFRLLDVWALPTPGGPDDFAQLVRLMRSFDPGRSPSIVVRGLFAIRFALGRLLGLDRQQTGLGARVETLRDRLPADLAGTATDLGLGADPFVPLYLTEDEFALEIANQTMHGVLHVGWVPDGADGYRGQIAVLVKPNGILGSTYMAAIAPFRYLAVYPLMLRDIGRQWQRSVLGAHR